MHLLHMALCTHFNSFLLPLPTHLLSNKSAVEVVGHLEVMSTHLPWVIKYGVPLVVPFAWVMLAHPVLLAARKVTKNWVFLYGGFGMMAWDLFLDPQMVSAERWTWDFTGSHVPFQPEIPLSNAFGWLLTGMGLMAILNAVLRVDRRKVSTSTAVPDFFLMWTWFAGVVGNLFFFDRTGVAFLGGLVFGLFLLPYIFLLRFGPPANN